MPEIELQLAFKDLSAPSAKVHGDW